MFRDKPEVVREDIADKFALFFNTKVKTLYDDNIKNNLYN
jgi:hypothetical protein